MADRKITQFADLTSGQANGNMQVPVANPAASGGAGNRSMTLAELRKYTGGSAAGAEIVAEAEEYARQAEESAARVDLGALDEAVNQSGANAAASAGSATLAEAAADAALGAAGWDQSVPDEAARLALTGLPANWRVYQIAPDPGRIWRWTGTAWADTGENPLAGKADQADLAAEVAERKETITRRPNQIAAFQVRDPSGTQALRVNPDGSTEIAYLNGYATSDDVNAITEQLSEQGEIIKLTEQTPWAFRVSDGLGTVALRVNDDGSTEIADLIGYARSSDLPPLQNAISNLQNELSSLSETVGELSDIAINRPRIDWPENLISFWDWSDDAKPYRNRIGVENFDLTVGSAAPPARVDGGPFGKSLRFTGSQYLALRVDDGKIGALDLAARSDQVTVIGWVNRGNFGNHFVAGVWQEHNADPRRQYGLFVSLPVYGGQDQVCGHISYTGGATPGYPYSRDYSTSAQCVRPGEWRMVAMTYDGEKIISYIDGIADSRPTFTDNQGQTYRKNPYDFDLGLNRKILGDFTVGGVLITSGMSNMMVGDLGGVAIFGRALSAAEILDLHLQTVIGETLVHLDPWYRNSGDRAPMAVGWRSYHGPTATDRSSTVFTSAWYNHTFTATNATSPAYMARAVNAVISAAVVDSMHSIKIQQAARIRCRMNNSLAADNVRLMLRLGTQWFASAAEYQMPADGGAASDWSAALNVDHVIDRDPSAWRLVDLVPGSALTLGSAPSSRLSGEITGIGLLSEGCAGVLRVANIKIDRR